jgi:hypothetical protein
MWQGHSEVFDWKTFCFSSAISRRSCLRSVEEVDKSVPTASSASSWSMASIAVIRPPDMSRERSATIATTLAKLAPKETNVLKKRTRIVAARDAEQELRGPPKLPKEGK